MAFEGLKISFTSVPVLAHVDPQKPVIIDANTLDFALSSSLSQQGDVVKLTIHDVKTMSKIYRKKFPSRSCDQEHVQFFVLRIRVQNRICRIHE